MFTTRLTEDDLRRLTDTYIHLHKNPELSMQEHNTAEFIESRLTELGIPNFRSGGTGVVGVDTNGTSGPVVAFRADTDGLPIAEETGAPYASTAIGVLPDGTQAPVMHGCGHDSHVAVALTAAEVFRRQRGEWSGTIVWIFQPGEETAQGAAAMVDDGLWEQAPIPNIVLGQHVSPVIPAGAVGITSGHAMSLADSLRVVVTGKQSHGSQPHDAIDPIVLASHAITRIQTIVSREVSPQTPVVVTSGTFHSGLKENIIPKTAEFTLNIRTQDPDTRAQVLTAVTRIINAEAEASGAPAPAIEEISKFPPLYNDPANSVRVHNAIAAELGNGQVREIPPAMGSEDFGTLPVAADVPGVFWFFGAYAANSPKQAVNHSPNFIPEIDPALATGVRAALSGIRHYLDEAAI